MGSQRSSRGFQGNKQQTHQEGAAQAQEGTRSWRAEASYQWLDEVRICLHRRLPSCSDCLSATYFVMTVNRFLTEFVAQHPEITDGTQGDRISKWSKAAKAAWVSMPEEEKVRNRVLGSDSTVLAAIPSCTVSHRFFFR